MTGDERTGTTGERLGRSFFDSDDVVGIARSLLGAILCTRFEDRLTAGIIVETEAYRGPDDRACHAYNFRRTARTEDLYGPPGTGYIYLCYGIHHLFNVVTAAAGVPHAVLIRAIEPLHGTDVMMERRKLNKVSYRLGAGPGILSESLGLTTALTGVDLTHPETPVWLETAGRRPSGHLIAAGPRIGVRSAGACALRPWRFYLRDNYWVSRAKP